MTPKQDPLKDKLDAMAIAVLAEMMTNDGQIKDQIPQSVQKALDVLKTLGGWYAIKNKVNPEMSEEGRGIYEFQNRLADSSGQGRNPDPARPAAVASGDAVPADATKPRRNGYRGTQGGRIAAIQKPANHHSSAGANDEDNGGSELARFVARIPGRNGSASDDQHGSRGPSYVAGRGFDSGSTGVESPGDPDLDDSIG